MKKCPIIIGIIIWILLFLVVYVVGGLILEAQRKNAKKKVGNGRKRLCTRKMGVSFLCYRFFCGNTTIVRHCTLARIL